jgi:hypothetical protein
MSIARNDARLQVRKLEARSPEQSRAGAQTRESRTTLWAPVERSVDDWQRQGRQSGRQGVRASRLGWVTTFGLGWVRHGLRKERSRDKRAQSGTMGGGGGDTGVYRG